MKKQNKGRKFVDELKSIKSIDLTWKAVNVLEKLLWGIIGILGVVFAVYFTALQLKSWEEGVSIITKGNFDLSNIKYPGITICPQVSTKYAIAERLGNFLDPNNLPEQLKLLLEKIQNCVYSNFLEQYFALDFGDYDWETKLQKTVYYGEYYQGYCLDTSHPDKGCKVSKPIKKIFKKCKPP